MPLDQILAGGDHLDGCASLDELAHPNCSPALAGPDPVSQPAATIALP
jgi:hypothetical protein